MQPTMFYLVGMPAVGKYTIAKEVAAITGARLVDNHSIANVIFNLFELDGVTPLPEGIFGPVGKVRQAVLDALTNLAPRELSYVFTIVLLGGDPAEAEHFHKMVEVAEQRGSLFVPVLLRCRTGELMSRAANESRVQRMKLIDPATIASLNDDRPQFETDHPNAITLDTTETPPAETALRIVEWAEEVSARAK